MSVLIPDEVVLATRLTEEELRREIAILLFAQDRLTLAQASRLTSMSRIEFQHLLASRRIPVHYDVQELAEDLETAKTLRSP